MQFTFSMLFEDVNAGCRHPTSCQESQCSIKYPVWFCAKGIQGQQNLVCHEFWRTRHPPWDVQQLIQCNVWRWLSWFWRPPAPCLSGKIRHKPHSLVSFQNQLDDRLSVGSCWAQAAVSHCWAEAYPVRATSLSFPSCINQLLGDQTDPHITSILLLNSGMQPILQHPKHMYWLCVMKLD